jgi:CheY-like chemotaxis protein
VVFRPDLILLDLMMPVMDGAGFRRLQLADARIASIPIVCLSATDSALEVAGRLGVPCIRKPADWCHLSEVVAALVR